MDNRRLETRRKNQAAFEEKVKHQYAKMVEERKFKTEYIIKCLAKKWCRSERGIEAIVWGQNAYRRKKRAEAKLDQGTKETQEQ